MYLRSGGRLGLKNGQAATKNNRKSRFYLAMDPPMLGWIILISLLMAENIFPVKK
jgi:hypothetical protein